MRCLVCCILTLTTLTAAANASVIPIAGYDINDAVVSGHGGWAHTYNGTVTSTGNFVNNTFAGTRANYSGVGSGTLNDGIIGTTLGTTQLFMGEQATDETFFDTAIFLTLSNAYTVDTINLYGGDLPGNGIPGYIEQVTVTLLKTDFTTVSETFATSDFGVNNLNGNPVNDRIDLTGSTLDGVAAFAVFLTDFTGPGDAFPNDAADNSFSQYGGWFSLTEIELLGELAPQSSAVPEPASIATMTVAMVLGGIGLYWRKRRVD